MYGWLTASHSFWTNLMHYEMKSHSSEAADLERSVVDAVMSSKTHQGSSGVYENRITR